MMMMIRMRVMNDHDDEDDVYDDDDEDDVYN